MRMPSPPLRECYCLMPSAYRRFAGLEVPRIQLEDRKAIYFTLDKANNKQQIFSERVTQIFFYTYLLWIEKKYVIIQRNTTQRQACNYNRRD